MLATKETTEMTNKELLEILVANNISKESGEPFNIKKDKKDVLFSAVSQFMRIQQEENNIAKYEVKYVGFQGQATMNSNSLPSRREISFPRALWVEVAKIDWYHFYRKSKKSIEQDRDPHWIVRKVTVKNKILDFFEDTIKSIRSNKIGLEALPHMDEHKLRILNKFRIGTIQQLLGARPEFLIESLGMARGDLYDTLDAARRSL